MGWRRGSGAGAVSQRQKLAKPQPILASLPYLEERPYDISNHMMKVSIRPESNPQKGTLGFNRGRLKIAHRATRLTGRRAKRREVILSNQRFESIIHSRSIEWATMPKYALSEKG